MKTHCSKRIQEIVGLLAMSNSGPRQNDSAMVGEMDCKTNSSIIHYAAMPANYAEIALSAIPQETKNNPGTAEMATAIGFAQVSIPQGCVPLLTGGKPAVEANVATCYISPGSPIFKGKVASNRLILYLFQNMHPDHRVKWYDMTGREQFEWYDAWVKSNKGFEVDPSPENVLGLRGTDVNNTITTEEILTTAISKHPSLGGRRPNGHVIPKDTWNGVARRLDFR